MTGTLLALAVVLLPATAGAQTTKSKDQIATECRAEIAAARKEKIRNRKVKTMAMCLQEKGGTVRKRKPKAA